VVTCSVQMFTKTTTVSDVLMTFQAENKNQEFIKMRQVHCKILLHKWMKRKPSYNKKAQLFLSSNILQYRVKYCCILESLFPLEKIMFSNILLFSKTLQNYYHQKHLHLNCIYLNYMLKRKTDYP